MKKPIINQEKYLFPLLLAYAFTNIILSSCTSKPAPLPFNNVELSDKEPVLQLKNWRLSRHYVLDPVKTKKILDVNFFEKFVKDEKDLTGEDFQHNFATDSTVLNTDVGIQLDKIRGKDTTGVCYLYCNLKSSEEKEVNLLFSGIQEAKLWLNNQLIYKSEWKSAQTKYYEDYIPAKLKRGDNFLLVKIALSDRETAGSRWNLNLSLSTKSYAKAEFIKDYFFTILNKSVVNDSAKIYIGPFINENSKYKISDIDGNILIPWQSTKNPKNRITKTSGQCQIPLTPLPKNNLYQIAVQLGKDTLYQDFIYGAYSTMVNNLKRKYLENSRKYGEISDPNFKVALQRLDYLNKKENTDSTQLSEKSHWDMSRVYFVKELSSFLKNGSSGISGKRYNGLISEYTSSIDQTKQYYLSYIPKKLQQSGKKIPFIFIMPFTYGPLRFLESWGISNYDQMWWEAKLAEENGFGVVWVDLRGHPGVNEIAITSFGEILQSLKAKYELDEKKIFILGNSASASKALSLATRLPSMFAVSVFVNPSIDLNRTSKTYANVQNMLNQKILLQHSYKDEIIPMKKAENFYEILKKNGLKAEFIKVNNNTHFISPKDAYRQLFSRIKNYKPSDWQNIRIATNDLKYARNGAFTVVEKVTDGQILLEVSRNENTITIQDKNISKLTIDLNKLKNENGISPTIIVSEKRFVRNLQNNILELERPIYNALNKNNMVEGPINHFFSNSFKVVQNSENNNLKAYLDKVWKKMYFSKTPTIKEVEVTEKTAADYNLLIIGRKWSNPTLTKICDALPLKFTKDSVIFRNKKYPRKDTAIGFVYPNPVNPKKYIYFIAMEKINEHLLSRDFTNVSWFDFEVNDVSSTQPKLIENGFFNNEWK